MFLTPIIYPTSIVPERFRELTFLNPMVGYISALRGVALEGHAVVWSALGVGFVLSVLVLVWGLWNFNRAEREFADII
jgi:lipopolysaccharide transport system permease protein